MDDTEVVPPREEPPEENQALGLAAAVVDGGAEQAEHHGRGDNPERVERDRVVCAGPPDEGALEGDQQPAEEDDAFDAGIAGGFFAHDDLFNKGLFVFVIRIPAKEL